MLPHLRKVEFKMLSSTSIIVRALLVDTQATDFQCDVDAHRALAGAILKVGTIKGGTTGGTIKSGGCLEGVITASVISTALRCGNEDAVREGKTAIFSGIIVTLELDGNEDLDWETVALPTTVWWPSKVTIIPQAGDKPDRIAAKGQKRAVPVWWTSQVLRNSRRFDITLNRNDETPTSMLVVGGEKGALELDDNARATAKAKPQRRSGAERRKSATHSKEAGAIAEVWQEISDEVHGRRVGPPACRVAAYNLAKGIRSSNDSSTSLDYYRKAAKSSLKRKDGRWLTEKTTAEAAIGCILDARGKGGGCGGTKIPCCLVKTESTETRSGKVLLLSPNLRDAPFAGAKRGSPMVAMRTSQMDEADDGEWGIVRDQEAARGGRDRHATGKARKTNGAKSVELVFRKGPSPEELEEERLYKEAEKRVRDRDHMRALTRESEEKAQLEFEHAKTTRPFPELEEVIKEKYAGNIDKPASEVLCPWVTGNGEAGTLDVQHRDILAVIFELINNIGAKKRNLDEVPVPYLSVWKCVISRLFSKNVIAGGTQGHHKVVELLHHRIDVTLAWLYTSGVIRGTRGAEGFAARMLPVAQKPTSPRGGPKDAEEEHTNLADIMDGALDKNLEGSGIA